MIYLKICKLANKDHRQSKRQYAHTFHKEGVICIARKFLHLPLKHQMGLIAHEVGHLIKGKNEHSEEEADKAANRYFKIKIKYTDTPYGKYLQTLDYVDTNKVLDWVNYNVFIPD